MTEPGPSDPPRKSASDSKRRSFSGEILSDIFRSLSNASKRLSGQIHHANRLDRSHSKARKALDGSFTVKSYIKNGIVMQCLREYILRITGNKFYG
jgi:hypothetical protein